ncbi:GNAT family N-acetyltransferase [Klebsiella quasipneumoniae]|uniref:aminoglycoside 6'-N-acetyltransferase n=1 Tax=Klebsiella quasipneumoniae TaxID=1463165 RepID=UPI0021CB7951|nr:aminoglycoside 6'-N-acetyltransferase [Klebsiella quasipneumoniae]MCU4146194.1 GNAT family N-acetyltransferase [Klebsiella quasipneumoniae]MCU4151053.1 GNAT family N-acetyltransferase [Klebsiella quasipneumoniae]
MSSASIPSGRIVPCAETDHGSWLELRLQLWPDGSNAEFLPEMAAACAAPERFAQFLFLSEAGSAEGMVEVALRTDYVNGTNSSPVAFLEGIFVRPESRGQGIAKALVATAEAWAKELGCSELASDAPIDNSGSHAMHAALGFVETERVVFFRKVVPQ